MTLDFVARKPRRTMTDRASASKATPTPTSVPARIVALQAQVGNRAVADLLSVQRDDKTKAPAIKFPGLVLGTNRTKQAVTVDHELGSPLGYRGRRQAMGVARMAKAPHAAVVETENGQWHALATTADFATGRVTDGAANIAGIREIHGVTPLARIDFLKHQVDFNTEQALRFAAMQPEDRDAQRQIYATVKAYEHKAFEAQTSWMAATLGVPEDDIERVPNFGARVPDKINIVGLPDQDSPGGGHAPMGGSPDFQQGVKSSWWIDEPEFDRTSRARTPAVMFHEQEHMADWDMTQQAVADYEKAGRHFVPTVKEGLDAFNAWINEQVKKKRVTPADAQIILDEIKNDSSTTEARANVREFLSTFATGDTDRAAYTLEGYAKNLKPKSQGGIGHYATPNQGAVRTELVAEAATMYKQLSAPLRAEYDAAVERAITMYNGSWLGELRMAKTRR